MIVRGGKKNEGGKKSLSFSFRQCYIQSVARREKYKLLGPRHLRDPFSHFLEIVPQQAEEVEGKEKASLTLSADSTGETEASPLGH